MAKTKVEKKAVESMSDFFSWRFLFMLVIFMAFLIGTIQVLEHYDRAWKAADYTLQSPYGQCLQECAAVGSDDLCVEECRAYVIKDTGIDTRAVEVTSFFRAPPTTSTAYQPQEVLAGHTVYDCNDETHICEEVLPSTTKVNMPAPETVQVNGVTYVCGEEPGLCSIVTIGNDNEASEQVPISWYIAVVSTALLIILIIYVSANNY